MNLEYILFAIIAVLVLLVLFLWRQNNSGDGKLQQSISELKGSVDSFQQNFHEGNKTAFENFRNIHERLGIIDQAQNNIQTLAGNVLGLQEILQNKQSRGAFGEAQMKLIIEDALGIGQYEFQATLSNNTRPDCLIKMPNNSPALVIDAKFPLEAWKRMSIDTANVEAQKHARTSFKSDVQKHIKDIAEKYLIAGETQDTALMFIPSESILVELYENFPEIIDLSYKLRVRIVSPNYLSLAIGMIQSILKDAQMREQAHLIQKQVGLFVKDLNLLIERVGKLKTHNDQTTKDIDGIITSTRKLTRHGEKIEELEFDENKNNLLE